MGFRESKHIGTHIHSVPVIWQFNHADDHARVRTTFERAGLSGTSEHVIRVHELVEREMVGHEARGIEILTHEQS